jgi:hypothetical protein
MENGKTFDSSKSIWLWLFPIVYVIHISEEYWGGEGYTAHLARTRGITMLPAQFLLLTAIGGALVTIAVLLARRFSNWQWVTVIIASAFLLNGISHTINALITGKYNPGLVTGILLWIPLGILTLILMRGRTRNRIYWITFLIGVGIQGVVSLLALKSGKLFGT